MDALTYAATQSDSVLDVTSQPSLWARYLRDATNPISVIGTLEYANAADERHATDLVSAHLIQTLSSLGRETIDFYFVPVRRVVEEYQFNGLLEALEMARQEGHIRHLALCCDGPGMAALGMWQFHDAFEVLLVPRNHHDQSAYECLAPVAKERRVGVVTSRPFNWGFGVPFTSLPAPWQLRNLTQGMYGFSLAQAALRDLLEDHPVMVGVRTAKEVELALAAPALARPEGLRAFLEPFLEAFESPGTWEAFAASTDSEERAAASRRARSLR